MTVQELINKLNESYKDKNIEVEFTIGRSVKQRFTRVRFMESMIFQDFNLQPEEDSKRACLELYP